jgi:hypothetical protein
MPQITNPPFTYRQCRDCDGTGYRCPGHCLCGKIWDVPNPHAGPYDLSDPNAVIQVGGVITGLVTDHPLKDGDYCRDCNGWPRLPGGFCECGYPCFWSVVY